MHALISRRAGDDNRRGDDTVNFTADQSAYLRKLTPAARERFLAIRDLIDRGILRHENRPGGTGALIAATDDPQELAEIDRVLGPRPSTH
jgi:hypothetical protein